MGIVNDIHTYIVYYAKDISFALKTKNLIQISYYHILFFLEFPSIFSHLSFIGIFLILIFSSIGKSACLLNLISDDISNQSTSSNFITPSISVVEVSGSQRAVSR